MCTYILWGLQACTMPFILSFLVLLIRVHRLSSKLCSTFDIVSKRLSFVSPSNVQHPSCPRRSILSYTNLGPAQTERFYGPPLSQRVSTFLDIEDQLSEYKFNLGWQHKKMLKLPQTFALFWCLLRCSLHKRINILHFQLFIYSETDGKCFYQAERKIKWESIRTNCHRHTGHFFKHCTIIVFFSSCFLYITRALDVIFRISYRTRYQNWMDYNRSCRTG